MRSTLSHFFLIALFILSFVAACTEPHEFTETETTRILKTLSSDEMRGRRAFTPDIKKAEDFIASEFEKAGLSYLEGMDSYRQEFFLNEATVTESSVTLNGKTLDTSGYLGIIYAARYDANLSEVTLTSINEGENFRVHFNEMADSDENLVVMVHNSFKDIFERYRAFYSRSNRYMDTDKKGNVVFILGDAVPKSLELSFEVNIDQTPLANVTGMIEGKRTDEFVLFSAHHDHLGIQPPVEGDSIANGANDDASGVTAVIELAYYFKSLPKPERSILFTTFTAEEVGGYGSQYFSKQLDPDQIVAMFNIEMIGKPAVSGPNTAWITGYDRSTFGELLSKSAEGTIYEFYPDPYPDKNLFYRSDNATLARLGVPAHSISTTPIDVDEDYHQVSDEFETIDIAHLTNTIKAISKAAEGIVSGEDTPTRIDTDLVN